MSERKLDCFKIGENVRVIKLQVVDNGNFRKVMEELAALVKKGRVVFVALNDEPFAVSEIRSLAKVVWNAADEVAGVESVMCKDPGQQRGGRGLAMRPGNHQRPSAPEEKMLQQLR